MTSRPGSALAGRRRLKISNALLSAGDLTRARDFQFWFHYRFYMGCALRCVTVLKAVERCSKELAVS